MAILSHVFMWMMNVSWFHTSSSSFFFIAWQLFMCTSYILVKSTSYFFSFNFFLISLPWFPPDFMRYYSLYFESSLSSLSAPCLCMDRGWPKLWMGHSYHTLPHQALRLLWKKGRKHLRARGSEWMSAVKQSLLDMNSWWLWRQSQDLNKINPNVDGR